MQDELRRKKKLIKKKKMEFSSTLIKFHSIFFIRHKIFHWAGGFCSRLFSSFFQLFSLRFVFVEFACPSGTQLTFVSKNAATSLACRGQRVDRALNFPYYEKAASAYLSILYSTTSVPIFQLYLTVVFYT